MLAALQLPGGPPAAFDRRTLQQMVDSLPVPVMTLDLRDFTINYANEASIEALRSIESIAYILPSLVFVLENRDTTAQIDIVAVMIWRPHGQTFTVTR